MKLNEHKVVNCYSKKGSCILSVNVGEGMDPQRIANVINNGNYSGVVAIVSEESEGLTTVTVDSNKGRA